MNVIETEGMTKVFDDLIAVDHIISVSWSRKESFSVYLDPKALARPLLAERKTLKSIVP